MKNRKILYVLLICVLSMSLLSGCSCITSGEIYQKEYIPAYSDVVHYNQVVIIGDQTTLLPQTQVRQHPDQWILYLQSYDKNKRRWHFSEVNVTEQEYNQYQIGMYYPASIA